MRTLLFTILLVLLAACWPVSFSFRDGSVPPEWKRFMVETFENSAPNAPIGYPPELTELVKDAIQNRVGLKLVSDESEDPQIIITGIVSNYDVTPMALQPNDVAAKNRLTITAQFEIFISQPEEDVMELRTTRFVDFDSSIDVSEAQAQLLQEINDQIIQDLINKLLSNW
jgi:outer membrane lipopolysaccharide assembly protein LptE/RlpB